MQRMKTGDALLAGLGDAPRKVADLPIPCDSLRELVGVVDLHRSPRAIVVERTADARALTRSGVAVVRQPAQAVLPTQPSVDERPRDRCPHLAAGLHALNLVGRDADPLHDRPLRA